ncbi:MAG: peptidoglycan DD-metalloendopeptidase family protein [Bacteroidaceae bacterium]|nr:peptidoglycan DD-metalloendopeptidase family protein [Bacteroidaceae bacterium]
MLTHLKHTTLTLMFGLCITPVMGQDVIARQAPIDHKMRAVDSIQIQHLIAEETLENPGGDLYPDWNSDAINIYGNVELPAEYRIDLRGFAMPIESRVVTSGYGYRPRFRRQHKGLDINAYKGDTIRAAFSGKVRVVAWQPRGYGNVVVIRHPNGLETVYGHLSKHLVTQMQTVKAGDPIGLAGNTGRSFGAHLHFETRLLGAYIDPAEMFDFAAQDVKGDFYLFRANGRGHLMDAHSISTTDRSNDNALTVASQQSEPAATTAQPSQQQRARQNNQRHNSQAHVHRVKQGESLYTIARRYGTSVDNICRKNGLRKNSIIRPGQIIRV